MKIRVFLSIFLGFLFTAILFSNSGPAFAEEDIHLKFYHAMRGQRGKVLEELIDKFNSKTPGIIVEGVHIQSQDQRMGNDYNALYKTILQNLAQNNPPDIAQVYENWTVQLLGIGALAPIGDYVGSEISVQEVEDIVPIFRQANTFNGKLWTLPFNKSIYVLYYNRDIFKKAGLTPPKTWEELRKTAKALTYPNNDGTTTYGLVFRPSVDNFGHYLYAFGGDFIEGNEAVFNSKEGLSSLKFWINLVHNDQSAMLSFTDSDEFKSGKFAMYIDTTPLISYFKNNLNFNWGVTMLPQGNVRKYQFAGTNIAVFSHLSPEKRRAAVKFVKFLTNKETTIYWALKTGYLPVRKSAINSPEYQNLMKSEPKYKIGVESLQYAVVQPKTAAWEMIRGIVNDAMFIAMSQRNTPDDTLNRAVGAANNLIKNLVGLQQ